MSETIGRKKRDSNEADALSLSIDLKTIFPEIFELLVQLKNAIGRLSNCPSPLKDALLAEISKLVRAELSKAILLAESPVENLTEDEKFIKEILCSVRRHDWPRDDKIDPFTIALYPSREHVKILGELNEMNRNEMNRKHSQDQISDKYRNFRRLPLAILAILLQQAEEDPNQFLKPEEILKRSGYISLRSTQHTLATLKVLLQTSGGPIVLEGTNKKGFRIKIK